MIPLRFGKFESLVIAQVNLYLSSLVLISTIPHQCFNSNDRFKQYSCCIRWIQKSPQFQNNLLNSFDLEKFLHRSSFSGLVSIEPILHCTRNILLPNSIPRKIWFLSPNETVSVSLSATFINFLLFTVRINSWVQLYFSVMWWAWSSFSNLFQIFSAF